MLQINNTYDARVTFDKLKPRSFPQLMHSILLDLQDSDMDVDDMEYQIELYELMRCG